MTKKTSVVSNALIWFGAGVSIAEILTGTYFAPLGMAKGFLAIVVGHVIGCAMMLLAGLIGALILVWIAVGITDLGRINQIVMALLLLLTLVLCKVIFFGGSGAGAPAEEAMSFGAAVELAVAMRLSWLPLISDYTREAENSLRSSASISRMASRISLPEIFVAAGFSFCRGWGAAGVRSWV